MSPRCWPSVSSPRPAPGSSAISPGECGAQGQGTGPRRLETVRQSASPSAGPPLRNAVRAADAGDGWGPMAGKRRASSRSCASRLPEEVLPWLDVCGAAARRPSSTSRPSRVRPGWGEGLACPSGADAPCRRCSSSTADRGHGGVASGLAGPPPQLLAAIHSGGLALRGVTGFARYGAAPPGLNHDAVPLDLLTPTSPAVVEWLCAGLGRGAGELSRSGRGTSSWRGARLQRPTAATR